MSTRTDLEWACLEMQGYKTERPELKDGFLRPLYQYTSMENSTVARFHENDYLYGLEKHDKTRENII